MKNIKFKVLSLLSVAAGFLLMSSPALASTYKTTNKTTTLVVKPDASRPFVGHYSTRVKSRRIVGDIRIITGEGVPGSYIYQGTFSDRGLDGKGECIGDITILRRQIDRSGKMGAKVTWKVKGGPTCTSVGKTYVLDLVEALPSPDKKGDFNWNNSGTWLSQPLRYSTWPKWKVTSSDGELNCRDKPNGKIKRVYQMNVDQIEVNKDRANVFELSPGKSPWLLTNQGCYVRANKQFIQPISMP
ncbi:hypothetical protein [Lyngbya sp. PCC 8106]|uniref:hypothetical protein n=1 Tax=Lyngbya sp. (strain PCC 8106) TaxID=313612 RepID=UPI0012EA9EFB|nr:hypothetical protein [Lyngbya sp. PCC 8106]